MSSHSVSQYIDDMLSSVQSIKKYYARQTEATDISDDELIADAIERQFIELGEAAHHLPSTLTDQFPHIPWGDIAGMRNLITHEYWGVDFDQLSSAIENDFPTLEKALQQMAELNRRIEQVTAEFNTQNG
jgi:uncharacterized protein with HEPN domain